MLPNYMRRLANMANSHLASIAKMSSFFLHQTHRYIHAKWQMSNELSLQRYFHISGSFPIMHAVLAILYNSYDWFSWMRFISWCIIVQSRHYLSTRPCEITKEHTLECHASTAIVLCVKFHGDHFTTIWTIAEWSLYRIWIMTEKR